MWVVLLGQEVVVLVALDHEVQLVKLVPWRLPRGIVPQSRGLVDHSLRNSARAEALVFDVRSCCCRRRRSLHARRSGLRVDVGLQNEERRFGTRCLGNLTDWRTGGESRYLLRRRRDAHSRSRRCGWGGPLLRQNEPKGRKPDDYQCGNDNDDHAHVLTLSAKAAAALIMFKRSFGMMTDLPLTVSTSGRGGVACYLRTSNAFSSSTGSDYEDRMVRTTSSSSQQPPRTSEKWRS